MEDSTFATPVHEFHFEIATYELWRKVGLLTLENKQNVVRNKGVSSRNMAKQAILINDTSQYKIRRENCSDHRREFLILLKINIS